ncbi:hypothetical protein D9K64_08755 [Klebsiella pneumoniae]|nr:hypothetical protein D9K64_08755 [Klebsiella pneumoniae]
MRDNATDTLSPTYYRVLLHFKRQKNALASIWLSFMAMSVHTKWKVIENSQLPGSYFLTILIQKAQKTQQIT